MQIFLTVALMWVLVAPVGFVGRLEARSTRQDKQGATHANPRPPSRWWTTEKFKQELKLTSEQSTEIEEIVQASMGRLKAEKDDLDRAQSDFRQMMEQPHTPQRELLKAAERLEMARYMISKERTTMLVRIHSVLTPDQRRGLDAIAKRAEQNRQK